MSGTSTVELVPRTAIDEGTWDELVHASPAGWPFALWQWQAMIAGIDTWSLEDHSVALCERGRLQAVLPLHFNPQSRVLASSGWGGSGPVCAPKLGPRRHRQAVNRLFAHVDDVARSLAATHFEFWLAPATRQSLEARWGVNPYIFHGCEDRSTHSQVVDLSVDEKALWRGLSETARQAVNKARGLGVTVARADWHAHLDDYYAQHCATYARTGEMPHPRAYFAGIADVLGRRGISTLWLARDADGLPLAFHNSIGFGDGAWYHTGCSADAALNNGGNYLLFWEALIGAHAAGRRWYDCGAIDPLAADTKLAGLSVFKRKFGGEPHRFLKCVRPYIVTVAPTTACSEPTSSARERWRSRLRRWVSTTARGQTR